jgi:hypothetical protein
VDGINIKATDEVKYLGLTITSNLSWGTHIRNICGIALKKLGFVKRIVGRFSDEKVKERCYFALVRPHLEYAASVWDTVQKDLIRELNKIQRKAARFVKNCYGRTDSVTQMLNELGWEPLETRRLRARLRLLEQLRMDIFKSDTENLILEPHYISRTDRSDKLREMFCRTDRYGNSFFPRTIRDFNKC